MSVNKALFNPIKSLLPAIFIVQAVLLLTAGPGYGGWTVYAKSEFLIFYCDPNVVRLPDNDTVRVWGKSFLNGKKGQEWLAKKSAIGILPSQGVENVCFASYLMEIKCSRMMIRELSYSYIDNSLTKLSPFDSFTSDWKFISPGSIGDKLHRMVCSTKR